MTTVTMTTVTMSMVLVVSDGIDVSDDWDESGIDSCQAVDL